MQAQKKDSAESETAGNLRSLLLSNPWLVRIYSPICQF